MSDFSKTQEVYWTKKQKRRDPREPVVKTYVEPKLDFILPYLALRPGARILEVGAGNGYFSYYLDQLGDLTATDFSPQILGTNPVARKKVMDARHLTFGDEEFDLVFCHALLHHLDHDGQRSAVKEMTRVSRRWVVIMEPNRNNPLMFLFGLIKSEERGLLDFSRSYLENLAKTAKLTPVRSCSFGFITPNRMPIPKFMLPLEQYFFERPLLGGITNVLIARKSELSD